MRMTDEEFEAAYHDWTDDDQHAVRKECRRARAQEMKWMQERDEALVVIRDLRRKLAEAGVEGSPPPGSEGTIPALMRRIQTWRANWDKASDNNTQLRARVALLEGLLRRVQHDNHGHLLDYALTEEIDAALPPVTEDKPCLKCGRSRTEHSSIVGYCPDAAPKKLFDPSKCADCGEFRTFRHKCAPPPSSTPNCCEDPMVHDVGSQRIECLTCGEEWIPPKPTAPSPPWFCPCGYASGVHRTSCSKCGKPRMSEHCDCTPGTEHCGRKDCTQPYATRKR